MSELTDETGSSLSDLFEILSHEYRRRILMAVAHKNPQDEDDLTVEVVANDHEDDDGTLDTTKVELHQMHLPKLAEAGFIEWDRDTGTITRGPRFEEIEPLLRLMHEHQDELPDGWP